jgi:hypothetical protein
LKEDPKLRHEFYQVTSDPKEPPAVREAALMAYSYFRHPDVYLKLHVLALQTKHPAWSAAVSRLGEVGNDFTLQHLDRLPTARLTEKDKKLVFGTKAILADWVQRRNADYWQYLVPQWLEYAAWAEQAGDPLRKQLTPWTTRTLAASGGPSLDDKLKGLEGSYSPTFRLEGDPAMFAQRVRQLARDILAARGKQR